MTQSWLAVERRMRSLTRSDRNVQNYREVNTRCIYELHEHKMRLTKSPTMNRTNAGMVSRLVSKVPKPSATKFRVM